MSTWLGIMSTPPDDELVGKIIEALRREESLTPQDIEVLREFAHFMIGLQSMSLVWGLFVRFIQAVGVLALLFLAAKAASITELAKLFAH